MGRWDAVCRLDQGRAIARYLRVEDRCRARPRRESFRQARARSRRRSEHRSRGNSREVLLRQGPDCPRGRMQFSFPYKNINKSLPRLTLETHGGISAAICVLNPKIHHTVTDQTITSVSREHRLIRPSAEFKA